MQIYTVGPQKHTSNYNINFSPLITTIVAFITFSLLNNLYSDIGNERRVLDIRIASVWSQIKQSNKYEIK